MISELENRVTELEERLNKLEEVDGEDPEDTEEPEKSEISENLNEVNDSKDSEEPGVDKNSILPQTGAISSPIVLGIITVLSGVGIKIFSKNEQKIKSIFEI